MKGPSGHISSRPPPLVVALALGFVSSASAVVLHNAASVVSIGPGSCVSLHRSGLGSCELTTNCGNEDTTNFEFAFNCQTKDGRVVRHSFGKGGFDAQETFDTEVECVKCLPPSALPQKAVAAAMEWQRLPQKAVASAPSSPSFRRQQVGAALEAPPVHSFAVAAYQPNREERAETAAPAAAPKDIRDLNYGPSSEGSSSSRRQEVYGDASEEVKFGPSGCVSAYRSQDGNCMMKTQCEGVDTSKYTFGLVCGTNDGAIVRHLFGVDSFDPVETFNTLLTCDKCLGLEDEPEPLALSRHAAVEKVAEKTELADKVATLGQEVKDLRTTMTSVTDEVKKISDALSSSSSSQRLSLARLPSPEAGSLALAVAPPAVTTVQDGEEKKMGDEVKQLTSIMGTVTKGLAQLKSAVRHPAEAAPRRRLRTRPQHHKRQLKRQAVKAFKKTNLRANALHKRLQKQVERRLDEQEQKTKAAAEEMGVERAAAVAAEAEETASAYMSEGYATPRPAELNENDMTASQYAATLGEEKSAEAVQGEDAEAKEADEEGAGEAGEEEGSDDATDANTEAGVTMDDEQEESDSGEDAGNTGTLEQVNDKESGEDESSDDE